MKNQDLEDAQLQRAVDNCASEPIHVSGAIQPHGFLIACDLEHWQVAQVSANVGELFGHPVEELIGLPLGELLDDALVGALRLAASQAWADEAAEHVAVANIGAYARLHDISAHVAEGLVHIELEPLDASGTAQMALTLAHRLIARVESHDDANRFHQEVADQVRALVGYDRVMIYRFDETGSGAVIAESRDVGAASYLGQHFPASDIPAQARRLYVRNRVRVIPDARYAPIPILPGRHADGRALDLSGHLLRSVAPVHLEYLRNMGVAASMSISIVVRDQLWGLIACHHGTPRLVSPAGRVAAELLGQFVSLHLSAREAAADAAVESAAQVARDALARRLAGSPTPAATLIESLPLVADCLRCDGVAVFRDRRWHLHGDAPDPAALAAMRDWAGAQSDAVLASSVGRHWHPEAGAWPVAGVLAIALDCGERVFAFRRERVREVDWAGQPEKRTVHTDDGIRLAPRRSFRQWREHVRGQSQPWLRIDLQLAQRLHILLTSAVAARVRE